MDLSKQSGYSLYKWENLGTSYSRGPLANGAILYWNIIGKSSHSLSGEIDELRIWNDVRIESEINDNMFNELDGDEAGIVPTTKCPMGPAQPLATIALTHIMVQC